MKPENQRQTSQALEKKKKLKKKNEANLDSEFQEKMQGRSLPAIFF